MCNVFLFDLNYLDSFSYLVLRAPVRSLMRIFQHHTRNPIPADRILDLSPIDCGRTDPRVDIELVSQGQFLLVELSSRQIGGCPTACHWAVAVQEGEVGRLTLLKQTNDDEIACNLASTNSICSVSLPDLAILELVVIYPVMKSLLQGQQVLLGISGVEALG